MMNKNTLSAMKVFDVITLDQDDPLEIAEDGRVRTDEYEDFMKIKAVLDRIAQSVSNLQLWMDEQIAADKFANQSLND